MSQHSKEVIDKLLGQLHELDENIELQSNGWQVAVNLIMRDLRDLKKSLRA